MTLLASPLESIESAVIWLLVVFSVATWGLACLLYTSDAADE